MSYELSDENFLAILADDGAWRNDHSELLPVYSVSGAQLGEAPRNYCHSKGLIHRTVFCFFVRSNGDVLLQTRKDGRLDVAAGGHVSADDVDPKNGLIREIYEEIGLDVSPSDLVLASSYLRFSPSKVEKPNELNREFRDLFVHFLDDEGVKKVDAVFGERIEKTAVSKIEWFGLGKIIDMCDTGIVADGLLSSFPRYLFWRVSGGQG